MRPPKLSRVLSLVLMSLFITLIFGGDFWQEKSYSEWSEKEINKMLSNSPWARKAGVSMKGPMSPGGRSIGGGMSGGGGGRGMGGGGGGRVGGGMGGSSGGGMMQARRPNLNLTVRWESALPVRQAMISLGYLKNQPKKIEEFLTRKDPNYIISVSVLPVKMDRVNKEQIASMASLKREDDNPVFAESVNIVLTGRGSVLYFQFPRTINLAVEDKEVEFTLELPRLRVEKKFDLRKMSYQGALSL